MELSRLELDVRPAKRWISPANSMKHLLAFFISVFCAAVAVATVPAKPLFFQVAMENGQLVYAFEGKRVARDQISVKLGEEIGKFGKNLAAEIYITDHVPLAALLEVHHIVTASQLAGPVNFFLAGSDDAPPMSWETVLDRRRNFREITIAPLP